MNATLELLALVLAGAALGTANAVGLWLSVRCLARSRRPLARLAAGSALRLVLTVVPVVLLARGRPLPLAVGLSAFVVARRLAVRAISEGRGGEPAEAGGTT